MSRQISLKDAERKASRTARRAGAARGFHRECAGPRSELQLPLPRPDSDPIQQPGQRSHEVVYGVTSLLPQQADAARLLSLVRGHWRIENRLH